MVSNHSEDNFVIECRATGTFLNEQLFVSLTANETKNFIMGKELHASEKICDLTKQWLVSEQNYL